MKNLDYYTKIINQCLETQCVSDLLAGKIQISEVPFEFRGRSEYSAAHKHARQCPDEKERCWQYWNIAKQMESDMKNLDIVEYTKDMKNPHVAPSEEVPEDSEYFNRKSRIDELKDAHEMYFEFATQKVFF